MESNEVVATTPAAAAAQLAALQADRAAMADRAVQPWWYDVLLGVLVAGFTASYSVHQEWVSPVALLLFLGGNLGLMTVYRRRTGTWVGGYRSGRTRRVMWVWLTVSVVVLAVGGGAEFGLEQRGAMAVAGIVLGLAAGLVSRWWTRVYVAELRSAR